MVGFSFPPPPPPPPRATANDAPDQHSSQQPGFSNARGGRGRGFQGRGRGNHSGGNNRGSHGNIQQRGGYQQGGRGGSQQHNAPQRQAQAGAYVQPQQYGKPGQSPMLNGNQTQPARIPPLQSPQTSSPQSNNKRKRGEHIPGQRASQGSPPTQATPPKAKPQRQKAVPPPAIPSFGFSLPSAPTPPPLPKPKVSKNDGEKRRKIHLGLTNHEGPQPVEVDERLESDAEEEEDIDEEAAFANSNIQGMSFEYNGQQISLQTPAEIAAWIKDRSKHFPTRKRIEEKAREAAERRANELEFLRKVQGKKTEGRQKQPAPVPATSKPSRNAALEKAKAPDLGDLRAKVQQSIAAKRKLSDAAEAPQSLRRPPPIVNLGLGYESESASDSSDGILDEESSVVSSSSDESSGDDDSNSDGAPETISSKAAPAPIVVPPPPPPEPEKKEKKDGICETWKKYGNCKRTSCRWKHPPKPPKEEPKPMSLFERLVEQENEKADLLALDAIKWLGRNGFLG